MKLVALLLPAAIAVAPVWAQDASEQEFAAGRHEYLAACAACHGENADGQGPIAEMLNVPVPNLHKLAANNDGVFPLLEVFQVIDGRSGIRAHGDPMPLFGRRYEADIGGELGPYGSEQAVRARVLELVYYLQSIQE
jgi:mono/diheme cytochrome c family protein